MQIFYRASIIDFCDQNLVKVFSKAENFTKLTIENHFS